ncbi:MAG: T9SS type A sorting domain-containing protein, partial [Methanococcaceae archaeon]
LATDSLIFLSGYIRGTTTLSVYAGTVRGNQWKDITAGLPGGTSYQPKALAVKDNWLYFGTGNITNGALWKYDLSNLLAVEDNPAPVKTFSLSQNYPNPFNPSTQISFHLPEGAKVTIRVYDLLGKEAAVLMDEYRSAGTHTVQFNASNLPSGMYIYQLRAGEHTSMRKMLLIK